MNHGILTRARNCVTFASWSFSQFAASQGSTKGPSGARLGKIHFKPGLAHKIQSHFRREGGCGELRQPIRPYEKFPQPFEFQMRCSLSVRDVKPRGAARNPRANPHEHSVPLGHGWPSGGCSALVSCAPNRNSRPLIPSLSSPHDDCNELRTWLVVVRAALERSDFAVRRVPLIFAWKKPQELDLGSWPTKNHTKKAPYNFKKAPWYTGRRKKENGGFCSFVPRAITHKPPPLARFRRAVAT